MVGGHSLLLDVIIHAHGTYLLVHEGVSGAVCEAAVHCTRAALKAAAPGMGAHPPPCTNQPCASCAHDRAPHVVFGLWASLHPVMRPVAAAELERLSAFAGCPVKEVCPLLLPCSRHMPATCTGEQAKLAALQTAAAAALATLLAYLGVCAFLATSCCLAWPGLFRRHI
jgi:hypothetical protein